MPATLTNPQLHCRSRARFARSAALLTLGAALFCAATPATAVVPEPQHTVPASVTPAGDRPAASSGSSAISADGRYVAYVRTTVQMGIPVLEVWYTDLLTGQVEMVSQGPNGGVPMGGGNSSRPAISADGRRVVFLSTAQALVNGFDAKAARQLYVRDMDSGITTAVSVDPATGDGAAQGVADSPPSFSADGNRVAFVSRSVLTAAPTGGVDQSYIADISAGSFALVSTTAAGAAATASVTDVSLSPDGTDAAFVTADAAMVAAPAVTRPQAFARDVASLTTPGASRLVSSDPSGANQADRDVESASVADSGAVVFTTRSTNLGPANPTAAQQVYLRGTGGAAELVTHQAAQPNLGQTDGLIFGSPSISADGERVGFSSDSSQLSALGSNNDVQTYVWTAPDGRNSVVSLTPTGALSSGRSGDSALALSGGFVSFTSNADDLVAGYGLLLQDQVYVRNLAAVPDPPAPPPTSPADGGGASARDGSGTERARLAQTGLPWSGMLGMAGVGTLVLVVGGLVLARRRDAV